MSVKYFCDRCKKEALRPTKVFISNGIHGYEVYGSTFELCTPCVEEWVLRNKVFLKNG